MTLHSVVVVIASDEGEDFGMRGIVGAKGNAINGHFLEERARSLADFRHANPARRHEHLAPGQIGIGGRG